MILPDNIEDMPDGTELVTPIEDEVMNVLRGKLEAWFNKKIDEMEEKKMNNYEVTYHFINGEVIKVKYRGVIENKIKFLQILTGGTFVVDKEMEIIVNIKQVNFMEVKELHEIEIENKNEIQGEELYDSIMKKSRNSRKQRKRRDEK